MRDIKEPITIIGAGPAGLTAAIVLARHGCRARVYEKSPDVGHRLSGDFQGLENWSSEKDVTVLLREIGIETNFLCEPYYGGTIYAPGMQPSEIASERPIFYLVRRGPMPGTLDSGLKEQALSAGVEIIFGRRLDAVEGEAIVATGPRGADLIAAGLTFDTSMPDSAVVVLDDEIAPKGYAYLLVNQGLGTMAAVLFRENGRVNDYVGKMIEFFRDTIRPNMRNEHRFGSFGNFFLHDSQMHDKKLFVGESGGFQDCLWGFGMRFAILSGHLAARSFIEGSDYDALWKQQLRPMLQTSLINRYLIETFGHRGYRYLTRKFAQGNPCEYLRRHYNYSPLKHLLLPLARRAYESRAASRHSLPL
jgi:flavin-dependent dehydrogenase